MSSLGYLSRSDVTLVGAATIIIIFSVVITATVQGLTEDSFSQIITNGPVWHTDSWICTSTAEFLVHGALISYADPGQLQIFVSGKGTQPDFLFPSREMISFSLGGGAVSSKQITRSTGVITGFLTLQTTSDATASCEEM